MLVLQEIIVTVAGGLGCNTDIKPSEAISQPAEKARLGIWKAHSLCGMVAQHMCHSGPSRPYGQHMRCRASMQCPMMLPQTPSGAAACCIDGIASWGCDPGGRLHETPLLHAMTAHLALSGLWLLCGSKLVGLLSWKMHQLNIKI